MISKLRSYETHERKNKVVKYLSGKGLLDKSNIKKLASIFECSESSISAAKIRTGVKTDVTIHTSKSMRQKIRARDGSCCLYCGDCSDNVTYVVEHVIPACLGGHAKEYNLVMSCQSCNVQKGDSVWIPMNINVLKESNSDWHKKILSMALIS